MNYLKIGLVTTLCGLSAAVVYYTGVPEGDVTLSEGVEKTTLSKNRRVSGGPKNGGVSSKTSSTRRQGGRTERNRRNGSVGAVITEVSRLLSDADSTNPRVFAKVWSAIEGFGESELLEATDIIKGVTDLKLKGALHSLIYSRWAELNPSAAIGHLEEGPKNQSYWVGCSNVLSIWAESDPEEALKWIQQKEKAGELLTNRYRDRVLNHCGDIFKTLASRSIDEAFEKMNELEYPFRSRALDGMASGLKDPADHRRLLDLTESLGERERDRAHDRIFGNWVQYDARSAVAYIDGMEPGDQKESLEAKLKKSWLSKDPQKAADWIVGRATGENRGRAVTEIVRKWGAQDPQKVAAWLRERSFEVSDSNKTALALNLMYGSPEEGVSWAAAIEDPKMKAKSFGDSFRIWRSKDQERAELFLKQTNLPEERKAALMAEEIFSMEEAVLKTLE